MHIIFDRSFSKSLNKLNDKEIKSKIEQVIIEVESADSLIQISHLKRCRVLKLSIASGLAIIELVLN